MLPADSPLDIPDFHILNTATGQVETVPVRDYVRGAVAGPSCLPPFTPKP